MPRPKVRYCPRGHDTLVVGRRKSGMCAECDSNRVTVWRWGNPAFTRRDNARRLEAKRRQHCMPESQFGTTPGSLEETLKELVALSRHLLATPANVPSRLERLEGLMQMLTYFSTPPLLERRKDTDGTLRILPHTVCSFADCERSSRDEDACLLNFARGGEPALWLCRDHHPPLSDGGIRPPGWTPPLTETERVEAARKEAMARLTRDQLVLVNGRMRGA